MKAFKLTAGAGLQREGRLERGQQIWRHAARRLHLRGERPGGRARVRLRRRQAGRARVAHQGAHPLLDTS